MEGFITVECAAELMGFSVDTIYEWAAQERIPSYKIAGRRLFRESELEAFIQEHRQGPELAQVVSLEQMRRKA